MLGFATVRFEIEHAETNDLASIAGMRALVVEVEARDELESRLVVVVTVAVVGVEVSLQRRADVDIDDRTSTAALVANSTLACCYTAENNHSVGTATLLSEQPRALSTD